MEWDSALYQKQHGFVADYGLTLTKWVDTRPGQRIWDLGCGTGTLTAKLAANGAAVIGTDLSESMISMATANHPGLDFRVADAVTAEFECPFNTVFSNAVFHWIKNQPALLANVYKALFPQGRLVCEMGAKDNIAHIEHAFRTSLDKAGLAFESQFFFPSAAEYARLLEEAGFKVADITEFDRPTPFPGGKEGMKLWLTQFYSGQLAKLPDDQGEQIIREAEARLRPRLWDGVQWVGDYRRLRFMAVKP